MYFELQARPVGPVCPFLPGSNTLQRSQNDMTVNAGIEWIWVDEV